METLERCYEEILSDGHDVGRAGLLYTWGDLVHQLNGYLDTERGFVGKYNSLGCATYLTGFLLQQEVARRLTPARSS
jgi:hypothetical protein